LDLAKINVTLTLALILCANITHKFNLWVTTVKIALRISSIISIIVTLVAVAVAIIAIVIVILFAIRRDKEAGYRPICCQFGRRRRRELRGGRQRRRRRRRNSATESVQEGRILLTYHFAASQGRSYCPKRQQKHRLEAISA
jgi:hypothetical protein